MGEEFALDALVEYGAEDVSDEMDRPNPEWAKLTRRLKKARTEVQCLRAQLGGEAASNDEATRRTIRGFKIAHAELRRRLKRAEARAKAVPETQDGHQANPRQRFGDAEDGEKADHGCDQDVRLSDGDGTAGNVAPTLCPHARGRPHVALAAFQSTAR